MNAGFAKVVESLEPTFQKLMTMAPVHADGLPQTMPKRGIYLFSDGPKHLYVGRTNNLRARIQNHCRASGNHNKATFAFRMARQHTGRTQASYRSSGSRGELDE